MIIHVSLSIDCCIYGLALASRRYGGNGCYNYIFMSSGGKV